MTLTARLLSLFCAALVAICTAPRPVLASERPLIFAAASLADALTDIAAQMSPPARLSFGGSGTMARQIDHGAPADVVVLANPLWMTWLEERGHVQAGTRQDSLGNRLALVGPPGASPLTELTKQSVLARLGPSGRLAIGAHLSVPAGQYARAWLEREGLWETVLPRLAETENVRAALALVSRAEVPLAIIYTSDLIAAPDAARPVWTIPDADQPPIRYSIAALTPQGRSAVGFLHSAAARATFARYGFIPESSAK